MSIVVFTSKPQALLDAIKLAIDKKGEKDGIDTWEYDGDGDFTHSPPQWRGKAWLHPSIAPGQLQFGLMGQKNVVMKMDIYGIYHGRFVEMLLNHFDDGFSSATVTAQKDTGVDTFKGA